PVAQQEFLHKPVHNHEMKPEDCLSSPVSVVFIDMKTVTVAELEHYMHHFSFQIQKDQVIHGFASWFQVTFDPLGHNNDVVILNTGPWHELTHWKQNLFLLDEPINIKEGEIISGSFELYHHEEWRRHLRVLLKFNKVPNEMKENWETGTEKADLSSQKKEYKTDNEDDDLFDMKKESRTIQQQVLDTRMVDSRPTLSSEGIQVEPEQEFVPYTNCFEEEMETHCTEQQQVLDTKMVDSRPTISSKGIRVQVQGVQKKECGNRMYDKVFACLYCGKLLKHRIVEHLNAKHCNETEVAKALAKSGKLRAHAIEKIKHKSNYKHNIKVINGNLIVAKRSATDQNYDQYLPCIYSLGFFKKGDLWKHGRSRKFKCPNATGNESSMQAHSKLLLSSTVESPRCKNLSPILDSMHNDEVYGFLKNDNLILSFGKILFEKLGIRRKHNISQRMRQLARIKISLEPKCDQLSDIICGKLIDNVVNATNTLCNKTQNNEKVFVFEKPGLALRLGHNLIKCAQIKRGNALRNDDESGYKEASRFLELMDAEWADKISSIALTTLKTNKFNKNDLLPLTSDLVKLKAIFETTLAKVVIFNKRRGGEAAQLLLETYAKQGFWKSKANVEILNSLSSVEKKLFSRLDIVQTQGKQNKVVPTLLTQEMIEALDLLVKFRGKCGVNQRNPYIFATQGEGYISTWQVMQIVSKASGCQQPELITSSRLRKYIATVAQVIDLSDHELQWLSSHLEHDLKTYKKYYRQQDSTLELTKVSKLLLAAEAGKLGEYTGKKLDDINVEDIEMPNIEEDDDEECLNVHDDINNEINVAEDSAKEELEKTKTTEKKTVETDLHKVVKEAPHSILTNQKVRWSEDENKALKNMFAKYLQEKCMPPGFIIKKAVATVLSRRTVPQVRAKIINIITNKQTFV
ncbi:hypothetical protein ACJMK2_013954, partial [Sinanodonta woodiana]